MPTGNQIVFKVLDLTESQILLCFMFDMMEPVNFIGLFEASRRDELEGTAEG